MNGSLKAGMPLREQTVAEEFGISRGPIRDAFLALTKEGLLHAKPNIGVKVAHEPSPFKRQVIVTIRREIESAALAEWFVHGKPAVLDELAGNLRRYEPLCRGGELGPVVECDMAFHRLIVESVDEGSLLNAWLPIIRQFYLRYSRHHSLTESHAEHQSILALMRAGRCPEAVGALRSHIL